jgi:hypothetical protein
MTDPLPQPLFTKPLKVFLALVLVIVTTAIVTRHPNPDLDGAIELLADGDLDHDERERMLLLVKELAFDASALRHRWAGTLATVALQDRSGFEAMQGRLGDGTARVLPLEQCEWLALGDVLLANLHRAMMAEASEEKSLASIKWGQVAAQARMTGNRLAAELAAAAGQRLK